jgi:hypothetical protein
MQSSRVQPVRNRAPSQAGGMQLLPMDVPVLETSETSDLAVATSFDLQKLTNRAGETQIARNRAIFVRFRAILRSSKRFGGNDT